MTISKMSQLSMRCLLLAGLFVLSTSVSGYRSMDRRGYTAFESLKLTALKSTTAAPVQVMEALNTQRQPRKIYPIPQTQKNHKDMINKDIVKRFEATQKPTKSLAASLIRFREKVQLLPTQYTRVLSKRLAVDEIASDTRLTTKESILLNNTSNRESRQLIRLNTQYPISELQVFGQHKRFNSSPLDKLKITSHNRRNQELLPFAPNLTAPGDDNNPNTQVVVIPSKLFLPAASLKFNFKNVRPRLKVTGIYDSNTNQTLAKADPRCPRMGVLTLEHPHDCDKYYYCEDGLISIQSCPNGLMYGLKDLVVDFCVHRWKTFCGSKNIPDPISSPGCRWQYGIFNVQGSPKCSSNYYECAGGNYTVKRCQPEGYVYDDRSKSCQAPHIVGCVNEVVANFRCPQDDQSNVFWPFPRYYMNEKALIHCVNDRAELVQCNEDEIVHPEYLQCIKPGAERRL